MCGCGLHRHEASRFHFQCPWVVECRLIYVIFSAFRVSSSAIPCGFGIWSLERPILGARSASAAPPLPQLSFAASRVLFPVLLCPPRIMIAAQDGAVLALPTVL